MKRYIIVRIQYDNDGEYLQEWFLEKRKGIIGWTTDLSYCASKFSYKDAVKELTLVKINYGYDMYDTFFKSEFYIDEYYA